MGGAAQPFAWATAFFAGVALVGSEALSRDRLKSWLSGVLKLVGWLAVTLVVLASLSLGTFLPAGVADWASPELGRFGGMVGLGVLALLFGGLAVWKQKALLLDFGLGCGLGAAWVGPSVAMQAQFPPPPTTAAVQGQRLDTIFYIGVAFLLIGFGLRFWTLGKVFARSFWRWGSFLTLLGLVLSLLLNLSDLLVRYSLLALVGLVLAFISKLFQANSKKRFAIEAAKYAGALVLMLLATTLLYFATNEDLEGVLLRNTLERKVAMFWRGTFGDERFVTGESGQMSGLVTDEQGKPLSGATVIVPGVAGQSYTATTDNNGRYLLKEVPAGNHLPIVARFGYKDEVLRSGWWNSGRTVVTIRAGQMRDGVDFVMKPRPVPAVISADKTLKITPTGPAFRDNPLPSPVLRSSFTFENDGKTIEGGLIHEPEAAKGPGPFPTLLIIYPGPANAWEGVSIPLAAQGYVVVSYQPQRGIDLAGDMRDLAKLMAYAQAGLFSPRADPTRISVVGGSVSTAYAYLLLRDLESSPTRDRVKSAIMYGGLTDMYRFRYDWERGALYIDPGISELEDLLVAFGRPDNRPEHYLLFSTIYHLDQKALPPTLLVHAEKDSIVPVNQSLMIDQKMSQLGIPHELLVYQNIEHYLDMSQRDPTQLDMLFKTMDFLKRNAAGQ
jgi:hypothetical protein